MKHIYLILLTLCMPLAGQTPTLANSDDIAALQAQIENITVDEDAALYGSDYGIISGNSADAVAETNATAIATAYAASSSTGRPLILAGTIYVKGQVLISGTHGTIIGYGAAIIQKDIAHNGLTFSPASPPYGIRIKGISITGQGATTHESSGIYARTDARINYLVGVPAAGTTVTINGEVYEYVSSLTTGNQILIGANPAAMAVNAVAGLGAHPTVTAYLTGSTVTMLSKVSGATVTISTTAAGAASTVEVLPYLTSDINLIDVSIYNFRRGVDIAGVAKFRTENVSIIGCRVGQRWNHLQTALLTNTRVVSGDGHVASACFEVTGGNLFANKVLMGEFGGANIARFLTMSSGIFHLEAANLENFSADQTFNLTTTGSKYLSIKNCRVACTYNASTDAIISAEVSGNSGQPFLDLQNIWGWAGSPRALEIYGTYSTGGGPNVVSGSSIPVTYAASQGGAAVVKQTIAPNVRHFQNTNNFPGAANTPRMNYDPGIGGAPDIWAAPNELVGYTNRHTGLGEWGAINNNVLRRVMYVSGRVASGNNVETDIHNFTLPIGCLLNNGESVDIELYGNTANNINNKQFRFYFGGSLYMDFGALPIQNESWTLKIRIQRGSFSGGTGYMKLVGTLDYGSGRIIKTAETPNATINSTATIATRVSVLTPTAANDAVSLAAKTVWDRAPQAF